MSLIDNERTKLLAGALDRASTACFTVGIATPLAGYIYDIGQFRSAVAPATFGVGLSSWLCSMIILHLLARRALRSLQP
ncbi:MAG TPA: hypothetical protein VGN97_05500 [Mesorhizobium sp.]|jgi:hypothetical protein|nr:hypothetical protein [Mesorhizobium sp.]